MVSSNNGMVGNGGTPENWGMVMTGAYGEDVTAEHLVSMLKAEWNGISLTALAQHIHRIAEALQLPYGKGTLAKNRVKGDWQAQLGRANDPTMEQKGDMPDGSGGITKDAYRYWLPVMGFKANTTLTVPTGKAGWLPIDLTFTAERDWGANGFFQWCCLEQAKAGNPLFPPGICQSKLEASNLFQEIAREHGEELNLTSRWSDQKWGGRSVQWGRRSHDWYKASPTAPKKKAPNPFTITLSGV